MFNHDYEATIVGLFLLWVSMYLIVTVILLAMAVYDYVRRDKIWPTWGEFFEMFGTCFEMSLGVLTYLGALAFGLALPMLCSSLRSVISVGVLTIAMMTLSSVLAYLGFNKDELNLEKMVMVKFGTAEWRNTRMCAKKIN